MASPQNSAVVSTASKSDYFVHESSYIDEDVEIGANTCIWHFCHIMSHTRLGTGVKMGQNVVVGSHVDIGNNVKIQNNVSVYEGVTLEDDVFCGPSIVFTNVLTPRSAVIRNTSEYFKKTRVCKGASLGANATIVCGVTIGEYALVGAGSVVTKDVPAYALVYGNPARPHGWACQCGATLPQDLHCLDCDKRYTLDNSNLKLQ